MPSFSLISRFFSLPSRLMARSSLAVRSACEAPPPPSAPDPWPGCSSTSTPGSSAKGIAAFADQFQSLFCASASAARLFAGKYEQFTVPVLLHPRRLIGPVYSSRIACALMPAETESVHSRAPRVLRRPVDPRPRLGVDVEVGAFELQLGIGISQIVGGSTLWCKASAALINPAAPAAGTVWLIIDFTDPSAQRGDSVRRGGNTRRSASTSTTSPTGVPVPCASTNPTVKGSIPTGS